MDVVIRLRHPEYGTWDQYVRFPDHVAAFTSLELIEGGFHRIVARIEHGQYVDLGSKIDRLIQLLEAKEDTR